MVPCVILGAVSCNALRVLAIAKTARAILKILLTLSIPALVGGTCHPKCSDRIPPHLQFAASVSVTLDSVGRMPTYESNRQSSPTTHPLTCPRTSRRRQATRLGRGR